MKNPYVVGSWVRGSDFYGRRQLVETLLDEGHRCIYLMGTRRSGKTSLFRYLEGSGRGESNLTLFLNFQAIDGDPRAMGRALIHAVNRKAGQNARLREIVFPNPCDFYDAICILDEAAEDQKFGVLLLLDEAEKLLDLDPECLERLRSAFLDRQTVRTILAATKRLSRLNDLERAWKTSPFLYGFSPQYVSPLTDTEAGELIAQVNHPDGPVGGDPELQAQIMDWTGNNPYLIQFLCSRLFQPDRTLRALSEADLVVADHLADLFQNDYEAFSPSERRILQTLAQSPSVSESGLAAEMQLEPGRLRGHMEGLVNLGYVGRTGAEYRIANRFLQLWLSQGYVQESAEAISDEASLVTMRPPLSERHYHGSGKAWAVLVGVNQYFDSTIPCLKVCADDVTAVQQAVAGHYQVAHLLVDTLPEALPTRSNILGRLSAISQTAGAEDLLLFYFSGHGVSVDGESYLLARDTQLSALQDTAISLRTVRKMMEQSPARARVVVLDACHSGVAIGKGEPGMSPEFIRHVFEEAGGLVVLASCTQGQCSWEWAEVKRSAFTYYLLESLSGRADRDRKGFVTVGDVNRYVTDKVKTWAAARGVVQIPTIQYAGTGEIILFHYVDPAR